MHPQNEHNISRFLQNEQVRPVNGRFAENTLKMRRAFLNGFAKWLENTTFQAVTKNTISDYLYHNRQSGRWSDGTCSVVNFLSVSELFFNWLDMELEEYGDEESRRINPVSHYKKQYARVNGHSQPKTPKKRTPLPSQHLFDEVFLCPDLTLEEQVVLSLCDQYFRLDEIHRIELDEIDFDNGVIFVPQSKCKGRDDKWVSLINKKFDPPDKRLQLIAQYLTLERPPTTSSYLLVPKRRGYHHKPGSEKFSIRAMHDVVARGIAKVFPDDLNLQKTFTSRTFRRHCISMFMSGKYGNANPWMLAIMVGHENTKTISTYTRFTKEDLINACLDESPDNIAASPNPTIMERRLAQENEDLKKRLVDLENSIEGRIAVS